ncbi:MAG TPA: DUF4157 domain-containing protein, partial [Bacteroidia bacterium]|nr:DUF4157 domain-containing protein [Bacteroidia bacterium]
MGGALANWAQRSVSAAPRVQAKLGVGAPHDAFEQEADEFAAAATNGLEASGFGMVEGGMAAAGAEVVQPKLQEPAMEEEAAVEETRTLRPKLHFSGSSGGGTDAPPNLPEDIGNLRGKGSGLPAHLRGHYERLLGSRLGGVRIHSGAESATLNRQIGARAFTLGQDIFFGQGQYNDASRAGQELIAHEVAHTVQQGNGEVVRRKKPKKEPNVELVEIPELSEDKLKIAIRRNRELWNLEWHLLDPYSILGIDPIHQPKGFVATTIKLQHFLLGLIEKGAISLAPGLVKLDGILSPEVFYQIVFRTVQSEKAEQFLEEIAQKKELAEIKGFDEFYMVVMALQARHQPMKKPHVLQSALKKYGFFQAMVRVENIYLSEGDTGGSV